MKIIIDRFNGKKKYTSTYELTQAQIEGKTLLGVLIFIKENFDITLNFTSSCRSSICGACAVRVNNHSYLACDTKMQDLLNDYNNPNSLHISPLANFKVICDLVVDWEPSIENLRKIKPNLEAKAEFSHHKGCKQSEAEANKIKKQWDCILCGACASECNKLEFNDEEYMQPFVYTRAYKRAADSRTKDPLRHIEPSVNNGLWLCVHCQECVDRCPKGVESFNDIANLRQMAIEKGLKKGVGFDHANAFYLDLIEKGRLNEVKLALRSDGVVGSVLKSDIAINLIKNGKLNPLHVFDDEIEGHEDLVKMLKAAKIIKE